MKGKKRLRKVFKRKKTQRRRKSFVRTSQQNMARKIQAHASPQMLPEEKGKTKTILVYLLVIIGIFILLNLLMLALQFSQKQSSKSAIEEKQAGTERKEEKISYEPVLFIANGTETTVEMKLPAVDTNKSGVVTTLKVTAKPGTGRTLVDIEGLLFWADTQQSIRTARQVAANITKIDINAVDLIYTIKAQASLIGGPSAGAALTIATIAALQGKKPEGDIMMSGAINHDGTIGPVSEILEKAKAAKESGATLFLVPLLQGKEVVYETVEHCEKYGGVEFCTQETQPKRVDVTKEAGIEIKEVENIQDAMSYFFKG